MSEWLRSALGREGLFGLWFRLNKSEFSFHIGFFWVALAVYLIWFR